MGEKCGPQPERPPPVSQLERGDSVHTSIGGETSNIAETGQTPILVSEDVDRVRPRIQRVEKFAISSNGNDEIRAP